ncbi:MAG: MGH1-like glycoside hydrolase domain-containing protein, partial [Acidimicrobiales bacterium]
WGPYLSERAWGTVREDYSPDGQAWSHLPHDHARSRAYRWNEDGLGGICDEEQVLCLAFAFWNRRDPILKERIFGLSGDEGNHGEDPKEYWWYLDSTPDHAWMRWRYLYPQDEFPYADLVAENGRRGKVEPEYELVDTGVFDGDRYWDITADYAKAAPDNVCILLRLRNAGPEPATIDVLPTLWFRNTWSWGIDGVRPTIVAKDGRLVAEHWKLGRMVLAGEGIGVPLFCENESNAPRLWGVEATTPYPKDGIADHVVHRAPTVNPDRTGTRAALRYRVTVGAGETAEVRLRLSPDGEAPDTAVLAERAREADEFYARLTPAGASEDEAAVMRQAFAGMLWSKQFFHYDVERWLDGDPAGPAPPLSRHFGRNAGWRHLNNADVISMPDKWEYPWYAAWDLAFHCVALAHVDAAFAKEQLLLLCREWYMHPNGQLPAYEWSFDDVNPPVQAWGALRVFEIDRAARAASQQEADYGFLARIFHKLLLNFTWWVNRKDAEGNNVFEGGFLGLDNIGPIDRSAQLPVEGRLEQSDGTAWMAMFCLNMLEISLVLAEHDPSYEDMGTKFLEHFAYIAAAIHDRGLWNEEDGFYYDVLHLATGDRMPLRVRSMVGLLPLCATTTLGQATLDRLPYLAGHFRWFLENKPQWAANVAHTHERGDGTGRLLAIVDRDRLARVLAVMLDEDEFLSAYGLRGLSAHHREHPFSLELAGLHAAVDYEPAESTTNLFGGNSNWRGPIWFPVNFLVIEAMSRYARYFGDDFTVELPTGSGNHVTLAAAADELSRRLVSIFLDDAGGRRPVFGGYEKFQTDPAWHGAIPFHEYFHGDTGMGLGAPHQTGWTGLVADLILRRR